MRKTITLLISILFAAGLTTSRAQNTWVQKNDLGYDAVNVPEPTPRYGAVGFSIGSKGYLGTGISNGIPMKDFWEYDPDANTWTQKSDFGGTARTDAVGFSIGSKGYLGTGEAYPDYYKDFWEYDPDANTWTQKSDFGSNVRSSAVGFSIGSKGYLGTGSYYDGIILHCYKDFWEYDPNANTWTQKVDYAGTAPHEAVGFSIGSKGYLGTGYIDAFVYKDFWEYDPDANTWTQKADFAGTARDNAVGFSIGSKGYIGTGYANDGTKKDFWEYDPDLNTWTQKADVGGTARGDAVGFSIGSKGYLGTGLDINGAQKDFWEYDPDANLWTQKADFGGTARKSAVGFSIGSKGYLGTGYNGEFKRDFWEYDPDADAWTQKADFGGTARWAAVGFSIGSKGYLGTGFSYDSTAVDHYYKDFWEYDPDANTWTQKADFGGTVRDGAVGFSIGSKGYLGTGFYYDGANHYYKDFWEYDPDADTWMQKEYFGGIARLGAVGFSIGNKGYLGTGSAGFNSYKKDFWEYDPDADTWMQKADFGGLARSFAVGFSIGSKGYLGTGKGVLGYAYDFWEFDPDVNTWTQKAYVGGTSRYLAVGFSIGSKGYLGTGDSYSHLLKKDFWEYTSDIGVEIPFIVNDTSAFSVFPNPNHGAFIIYLELRDEENEEATVEVLNMLGQKVYSHKVHLVDGMLQKEIQLGDVAADGEYVVKVIIDDRMYSSQISYQK